MISKPGFPEPFKDAKAMMEKIKSHLEGGDCLYFDASTPHTTVQAGSLKGEYPAAVLYKP